MIIKSRFQNFASKNLYSLQSIRSITNQDLKKYHENSVKKVTSLFYSESNAIFDPKLVCL